MWRVTGTIACCDCGKRVARKGRNHKRCDACRVDRMRIARRRSFQRMKADPARYEARKERVNAARRSALTGELPRADEIQALAT